MHLRLRFLFVPFQPFHSFVHTIETNKTSQHTAQRYWKHSPFYDNNGPTKYSRTAPSRLHQNGPHNRQKLIVFNNLNNIYSNIQYEMPDNSNPISVKKWYRYRPGVAQRVGTGIALLFHDHGTRRGWVVSSAPRPHFTPGKDLVPIVQEAGWAPGPVRTGEKSRPHRDSIPDRSVRSQSIYQLCYPAHWSPYGN